MLGFSDEQTCEDRDAFATDMAAFFRTSCRGYFTGVDFGRVLRGVLGLVRKHRVALDANYMTLVMNVLCLEGMVRRVRLACRVRRGAARMVGLRVARVARVGWSGRAAACDTSCGVRRDARRVRCCPSTTSSTRRARCSPRTSGCPRPCSAWRCRSSSPSRSSAISSRAAETRGPARRSQPLPPEKGRGGRIRGRRGCPACSAALSRRLRLKNTMSWSSLHLFRRADYTRLRLCTRQSARTHTRVVCTFHSIHSILWSGRSGFDAPCAKHRAARSRGACCGCRQRSLRGGASRARFRRNETHEAESPEER